MYHITSHTCRLTGSTFSIIFNVTSGVKFERIYSSNFSQLDLKNVFKMLCLIKNSALFPMAFKKNLLDFT